MEVSPRGAQVPAPAFPVSAGSELVSPSELRPDPVKHQDVHRVTSEFSSRHDKPCFSFEKFLVNIATAVGAAGRLQDPEFLTVRFLMQRTDFYNKYITTVWQKKEKKIQNMSETSPVFIKAQTLP